MTVTPGQTVTVDDIVAETGLSPETTRMVLDGLAKAGLFERRDDQFIRRSLFRSAMTRFELAVSR